MDKNIYTHCQRSEAIPAASELLTHVRPWRSAGKVGFVCVAKPVRWAAPPT
ncbi:MAG: hypothetical protein ACYTXC_01135 [Nostoc sp.]